MEIKRIDPKEFLEAGYLQEVNRLFLHPLGLALEVFVQADGTAAFGGVWDYRSDAEGLAFDDEFLDSDEGRAKAQRVAAERAEKLPARLMKLGYAVQPVPGYEEK
jgi:hypothetical protein